MNKLSDQGYLADLALQLSSPLIQKDLLKDRDFIQQTGIPIVVTITLHGIKASFNRALLFSAIRLIYSGEKTTQLADQDGSTWTIEGVLDSDQKISLFIKNETSSYDLPNFSFLADDIKTRLVAFNERAESVNLPQSVKGSWLKILEIRALSDQEFNDLEEAFRETPIYTSQIIEDEASRHNSLRINYLVPNSLHYFEQLVGIFDGSNSINDYALATGKQFFEDLSIWHPYEGFLYSLFLSSHSALTAQIPIGRLSKGELVTAFEFLAKGVEVIPQIGAIEIGFRILQSHPEIEPLLITLIKGISSKESDKQSRKFRFLSSLFILVDGELSRTKIMQHLPAFYRRLASLSQAALIQRELIPTETDVISFSDWVLSDYHGIFYLQSLIDMRIEPRWNPEFASQSQLKAEILSRVIIAARSCPVIEEKNELFDLTLGSSEDSLYSKYQAANLYFPGPLEGGVEASNTLPTALSEIIETHLNQGEVSVSSFIPLLNCSNVFKIDSAQNDLAVEAIRRGAHRLEGAENTEQFQAILEGLATTAASTRNIELADSLKISLRRYRNDINGRFKISINECFKIILVAAASRSNLEDWMSFIGDCLIEFAFGELDTNEANELHALLLLLLQVEPRLWLTCGRAVAALESIVI